MDDAGFAQNLRAKLKQSSFRAHLTKHDIETEEVMSRVDSKDAELLPLYSAQSAYGVLGSLGSLGIGVWALTQIGGFGGILSTKNPEEIREIVLEGLADYL